MKEYTSIMAFCVHCAFFHSSFYESLMLLSVYMSKDVIMPSSGFCYSNAVVPTMVLEFSCFM